MTATEMLEKANALADEAIRESDELTPGDRGLVAFMFIARWCEEERLEKELKRVNKEIARLQLAAENSLCTMC